MYLINCLPDRLTATRAVVAVAYSGLRRTPNPVARKASNRRLAWPAMVAPAVLLAVLDAPVAFASFSWTPVGPGPARFGQVENISPNNEVSGAIHTVLPHPRDANILYVGAVNGGVWRTNNATAASPTWTPLTDFSASLSIGALAFDPTDPTSNTLVAGVGRYSSFAQRGGARTGLIRSTDGGSTWTPLSTGMSGRNISGVVAQGNTIVASVNTANSFTYSNIGIFRSTDGGSSFTQVSQGNGASTGLPGGASYDLVADPTNNAVLYTSTVFSDGVGGTNGIYRSTDTGATWTKVSTPAIDSLITNGTSNLELAVGKSGEVYAAVINSGQLAGFFRSPTGNGGSWVQIDTPKTNENGFDVGLNPSGGKGPKPGDPDFAPEAVAGGQGTIHFAVVADPDINTTLYVGGDRQPRSNGDTGFFPNSIGAFDFTGRLFRGDTTRAAGSQFVHLTHSRTLGAAGGGTANSSAPHADSRDMAFDANGQLIEVDDGGIYRRTNPKNNTGDWFSINGNLQVTEIHDIVYDRVSNIIISGNQDTGTTQQSAPGSTTWDSVSTADGGDVAVDVLTLAGSNQSIRYSSFQNLGAFRRSVYNADGSLASVTFPALSPLGGVPSISGQFVTPVETNAVAPSRILIGGRNGLYESLNQGSTVSRLSTAVANAFESGNSMAYGGFLNGVPNPDVLYIAVNSVVHVRTTPGGAVAPTPTAPSNSRITSIELNDQDWRNAYVLTLAGVFSTPDTGATWSNITGDILTKGAFDLRSLEFIDLPSFVGFDLLLVGAGNGVYFARTDTLTQWTEMGGNTLPNVPVWDMHYDTVDDILVVGTLGRGAWAIPNFSAPFIPEPASLGLLAGAACLGTLRPRRRRTQR